MFDADGYYRTGDIVVELEPDHLQYVDRRNIVLKLVAGRIRHGVEAGGGVREQPAGPSDLHLRQQCTVVSAGGGRADRRRAAQSATHRRAAAAIGESLQDVAKAAGLQSYEMPARLHHRDNAVHIGERSADRYPQAGAAEAQGALRRRGSSSCTRIWPQGQATELRELRQNGGRTSGRGDRQPRGGALLGAAAADVHADAQFTDLGGDSLSALTFANLLREIFDVDVPVGVIVSPANDLAALAEYIEARTRRQHPPDVRVGSRPRGHRGPRRRSDARQVPRCENLGERAGTAVPKPGGAHGSADRRDRIPRPLPGPGVAGTDEPRRRQGDLPRSRQGRRRRAAAAGRNVRQRRCRIAQPLPAVGRRAPGGARRRQGRCRTSDSMQDLAAAGRHRRSDRGSRRTGQPRPALRPVVRTQCRRNRRADPAGAHHEVEAVHLSVDGRCRRSDRTVASSSRTPTSVR